MALSDFGVLHIALPHTRDAYKRHTQEALWPERSVFTVFTLRTGTKGLEILQLCHFGTKTRLQIIVDAIMLASDKTHAKRPLVERR